MPSVIEQCTQALQQGHFTIARDLARGALAAAEAPAARLPLLELLAQAQAGAQDHADAAQSWQQAYEAAAHWATLLHVHRSSDIGSPRVTGSPKISRACTRGGSCILSGLYPCPDGVAAPRSPVGQVSCPVGRVPASLLGW